MRLRSQNKSSQSSQLASSPMIDVILTILAFSIIVPMSVASLFQPSKTNAPDAKKSTPNVEEAAELETCQLYCKRID